MPKILFSLLFVIMLVTYSDAAILVFSQDGTYVAKPDLATANASSDVRTKKVVVMSALSAVQSNISSASVHSFAPLLEVAPGGSINPTTTFRIANPASSITPEWFGAVGNGITDDTVAFNRALKATPAILQLQAKTYRITTVVQPSRVTIVGMGMNATTLKAYTNNDGLGGIYADSNSSTAFISNIGIRDLTIDNTCVTITSPLSNGQWNYLVSWNGVAGGTIERVKFYGMRGDGIFLGAKPSPIGVGVNRHNSNITIRDCYFDGLSVNRNGISVGDCDGILITGNTFVNCSTLYMPGAIDFELEQGVPCLLRNVVISHNNFSMYQGNGAIQFVFSSVYNTQPSNIVISDNVTTGSTSSFIYMVMNTTIPSNPYGFAIKGNIINNMFSLIWLQDGYLRGATISENLVYGGAFAGWIGYNTTTKNYDLMINNNLFYGTVDGLHLGETYNSSIANNIFDGQTNGAGAQLVIGGAGSPYSNISVTGNQFLNATGNSIVGVGNWNPATNIFRNNMVVGSKVYFDAFLNDNTGMHVNSGSAVYSFNTATLPNAFPTGISLATLSGDANTPIVNATGTLTTYKLSGDTNYISSTYQEFRPTYNATGIYIRQAGNATSWGSWITK